MSVNPVPSAIPGIPPDPPVNLDPVVATRPAPKLTPNPYGVPDRIVSDTVHRNADRQGADLRAAAQSAWNGVLGDDLNDAADSSQAAGTRFLHAGLAGATILTLPAGPEALGLKLIGKEIVKGGMERLTFHATGEAAAKGGSLVLEGGRTLTAAEGKVASELTARGHSVVAKATSRVGKSADFVVDGKPTELKTISHVKADSVRKAVSKTIVDATKQAKHVIIDARDQRGLTEASARDAVRNAVRDLPTFRVAYVRFLGRQGNRSYEFTVTK